MTDRQEFTQGSPLIFAIVFGVITAFIGLILAVVIKPLIGLLAIVAAIAIPFAVWYLSTRYKIVCTPETVTIDSESKRLGAKHQEIGWVEITQTRYYELQGDRGDRQVTPYFEAYRGEERLFKVSRTLRKFHDLIETFNARATNVPYVWQRQGGLSIGVGPVTAGRSGYVQVNRGVTPSASPPPLP